MQNKCNICLRICTIKRQFTVQKNKFRLYNQTMKENIKNILINTIKISAAAIAAILLAEAFGLENSASAGIVAILTVLPTKKETLKTAVARCLAFVVALLISAITYNLIGFDFAGFFVYLVAFILVCQCFSWYSAMAMDSVIILHFIGFGSMAAEYLINEILIFAFGICLGILANLSLVKDREKMGTLRNRLDNEMKNILFRMSERMKEQDKSDYNGDCFKTLNKYLYEAETMAVQNYDNQFGSADTFDMEYVSMRRRQEYALIEMYKLVRNLKGTPATLEIISDFLKKVSEEYARDNTVEDLLAEFRNIDAGMKSQPLPKDRSEFEDRAELFVLLRKLEEFLEIKREFMRGR